jgi:hypothetical protein
MLKRLCIALALLGLWTAMRLNAPAQAQRWEQALGALSAPSCDLFGACETLGSGLSRGEDAVACLGTWCEAVFLPQSR